MSTNKYKPHLYVIPEDHRDEQIANGFANHFSVMTRQIQVVAPAGGWSKVLDIFKEEYEPLLQNPNTHVVLLIDFDGAFEQRWKYFDSQISKGLRNRVFVLGSRDTPEALKRSLNKSYEEIGGGLAEDCTRDRMELRGHEQLWHNDSDRLRLVQSVKPFLLCQ